MYYIWSKRFLIRQHARWRFTGNFIYYQIMICSDINIVFWIVVTLIKRNAKHTDICIDCGNWMLLFFTEDSRAPLVYCHVCIYKKLWFNEKESKDCSGWLTGGSQVAFLKDDEVLCLA